MITVEILVWVRIMIIIQIIIIVIIMSCPELSSSFEAVVLPLVGAAILYPTAPPMEGAGISEGSRIDPGSGSIALWVA
jgi:hypothetical protein